MSEIRRGDLLLGLGVHRGFDADFPLGGLSGDLWSVGRVTVAWGPADAVLLEVEGDAWRILSIESRGPGAVELEPSVEDGTTADAGDFEIGMAFMPVGGASGLSAGGTVRVRLPNSDERKGIGPNTTDVTLGGLVAWGGEGWRLTGLLGVAILEAPLETFEQNDVLRYALDAVVAPSRALRVGLGVDGRANTRDVVPLGTEDAGIARAGVEWRPGAWGWDMTVERRLTGDPAAWSIGAGVSWLRPRR